MASSLIVIEGQVVEGQGAAARPVSGASVIAKLEGTQVRQETDQDGRYTLQLQPGRWRISAECKGYTSSEPFSFNFAQDTPGIDFQLTVGYSLAGTVFAPDQGKGLDGAVVKASAKIGDKTTTRQEGTSASGDFRFTGLPAGEWSLWAMHPDYKASERRILKIDKDEYNHTITLSRLMEKGDYLAGYIFFAILCLLLLGLTLLYLQLHRAFPNPPDARLASMMLLVDQSTRDVEAITETQTVDSIQQIQETWVIISNTLAVPESQDRQMIQGLLASVDAEVSQEEKEDTLGYLMAAKQVLASQKPSYFWVEPPMSFLESVFWSLAGILVSLLVTSGYYLRRSRFYWEGISMHVSHLFAVPFLVLVFVFLISQIKLTVTINQNSVFLDVSDPRLLAALSFIIAAMPWKLLDFVRDAGTSVLGQARRAVGGSEPGGSGRTSEGS